MSMFDAVRTFEVWVTGYVDPMDYSMGCFIDSVGSGVGDKCVECCCFLFCGTCGGRLRFKSGAVGTHDEHRHASLSVIAQPSNRMFAVRIGGFTCIRFAFERL